MPKHQTILRCSQTAAFFLFLFLGLIFTFAGCAQMYKALGLTDQQAADQVAKDQDSRGDLIDQVRTSTTEIISTALAGLGAIASGFLAKWLGTERKITKALITGIESAKDLDVKRVVKSKATAAGIEPKLAARVRSLT